jgi:hypothetical protein
VAESVAPDPSTGPKGVHRWPASDRHHDPAQLPESTGTEIDSLARTLTFLAKEIDARKGDNRALRRFMSRWTVFSDFMYLTNDEHIENHTLYRQYAEIFPEAYFILTDRDVDRWVSSRLRHRDGQWLARYLNVHGGTRAQAVDIWKAEFLRHRAEALDFFRGHPRFLHFQIDKADYPALLEPTDIHSLVDLLAPDYELSPAMWTSFNTQRRHMPPDPGP